MTSSGRGRPGRALASLLVRPGLAGLGFIAYLIAAPHIRIDRGEQVAPAMFALAGVIGVFAGFTATSVVFIAAANGPGIDQIRRNHGRRLTTALLSAVVVLLVSAIGQVLCGLFANGWGAKGVACALLVAPAYDVVLVLLALRTAINSVATPVRTAQNEDDL
jgi:hypothetical protein